MKILILLTAINVSFCAYMFLMVKPVVETKLYSSEYMAEVDSKINNTVPLFVADLAQE